MKNVKKYLLCIVPLIVSLAVQTGIAVAGSIFCGIKAALGKNPADTAAIQQDALAIYMSLIPAILIITHLALILISAIWAYFSGGKQKPGNPIKIFSPITIPVMILGAIGVQYVCTGLLMLIYSVSPDSMENYSQLMQASGLGTGNLLSLIAAICLAPIGEELLFRCLTMNFAKRAGMSFWIANIVQALCFAISHLNLIQGIYAFFMGIVFGYVCEKYKSLYAPIILHALVNFMGSVMNPLIVPYFLGNNENPDLLKSCLMLIMASVILLASFMLLKKEKEQNRESAV